MADGPRYRVKLRRRREGKTNYYARREMLKSSKTRLVIRKSTKHMRVQFVNALPDGDITLVDTSSYGLKNFGWKLNGNNIPSAYLTGYLAGKRAKDMGINDAILDIGLQSNTRGSRIYSGLKGVLDAGVSIPTGDDIFPEEDIIKGDHIKNAAESYSKSELKKLFSTYAKNKIDATKIAGVVDKAIKSIDLNFAKKATKKPAKKAAKKPAKKEYDDIYEDGVRQTHMASPISQGIPTKKKRGIQISSKVEKISIKDLKGDADKEDTTWSVKSKELTDEEREARRQRQEMLRAAERITREIPLPPKPIKAVKSGKKVKVPKPIKKQKDEKVVQQQVKKSKAEKKAERFVDYYKAKELISSNVSDKPKIYSSKKGKEEPRVEIKRDTLLGRFSSKRRSRRNVNDRQMIVDIIDEYEAEMLIGQKIYYEMNNVKISGYIVRRFGKKKNKKVLANFKNGLSEEAKYKNVYKY